MLPEHRPAHSAGINHTIDCDSPLSLSSRMSSNRRWPVLGQLIRRAQRRVTHFTNKRARITNVYLQFVFISLHWWRYHILRHNITIVPNRYCQIIIRLRIFFVVWDEWNSICIGCTCTNDWPYWTSFSTLFELKIYRMIPIVSFNLYVAVCNSTLPPTLVMDKQANTHGENIANAAIWYHLTITNIKCITSSNDHILYTCASSE